MCGFFGFYYGVYIVVHMYICMDTIHIYMTYVDVYNICNMFIFIYIYFSIVHYILYGVCG